MKLIMSIFYNTIDSTPQGQRISTAKTSHDVALNNAVRRTLRRIQTQFRFWLAQFEVTTGKFRIACGNTIHTTPNQSKSPIQEQQYKKQQSTTN